MRPRPAARTFTLLAAAALATGFASGAAPAPHPAAAETAAAADIVLIVTDDQRWDTLDAMPRVQRLLAARGMTFENAFVTNPLCCPSRATILSGRYSHTNGVYWNSGRYGAGAFDPSSTVATWLDGGGYDTMLAGKYLNRYHRLAIPPGWDRWSALFTGGGEGAPYYRYTMNVDGRRVHRGREPQDYSTDVLTRHATAFIREADGPLFLYFAPVAPHKPARPASRHRDAFGGLEPWRPPSYDESAIGDKPAWLQAVPHLETQDRKAIDALRRRQLQSLQAVDEAVRAIVRTLAREQRLDNTLIVFTSDNGLFWGEHRLDAKYFAYEESARVPMIVFYEPLIAPGSTDHHLVANVDLAPTIADVAGVAAPAAEGTSMVPLFAGGSPPWREDLLIEHLDDPDLTLDEQNATYCAVRSATHLYVYYETGEEELYDLTADPHQLDNAISAPGMGPIRNGMRTRVAALCDPPPPGLQIPF